MPVPQRDVQHQPEDDVQRQARRHRDSHGVDGDEARLDRQEQHHEDGYRDVEPEDERHREVKHEPAVDDADASPRARFHATWAAARVVLGGLRSIVLRDAERPCQLHEAWSDLRQDEEHQQRDRRDADNERRELLFARVGRRAEDDAQRDCQQEGVDAQVEAVDARHGCAARGAGLFFAALYMDQPSMKTMASSRTMETGRVKNIE